MQLWLDIPSLLGYLKGQAFHRPFTKEEEAKAIERFMAGDEQARLDLIERNMRLVAHVVKKFHPQHEQLDDYISIGTIGLMKAVSSYTPDKKTRLATYAARCIENEIIKSIVCTGCITMRKILRNKITSYLIGSVTTNPFLDIDNATRLQGKKFKG